MKRIYIIGSDKGGVGKTEVALQTIFSLRALELDPKIGEVDSVQRLSMILNGEVDASIAITPAMLSDLEDTSASANFFGPILATMTDDDIGSAVIDLGATISGQFIEWIGSQEIIEAMQEQDYRPVFVAVAAPEASSLSGALRYLSQAQAVAGVNGDYVIAFNDTVGSGFEFVDEIQAFSDLIGKLEAKHELTRIYVPHAKKTKLISTARRNNWGIHEAYEVAADLEKKIAAKEELTGQYAELAHEIGLTKMTSRAEQLLAIRVELRAAMK